MSDLGRSIAAAAFEISFDGRPISVIPGQTVAAALIASGSPAWHEPRGARSPRGVFCGIGVCFDCLVELNGSGPIRACLITAEPGDVVGTHRRAEHE